MNPYKSGTLVNFRLPGGGSARLPGVWLQDYGWTPGKLASDLREGDIERRNFGGEYDLFDIVRDGIWVRYKLRSRSGTDKGKVYDHKRKATTLVPVALESVLRSNPSGAQQRARGTRTFSPAMTAGGRHAHMLAGAADVRRLARGHAPGTTQRTSGKAAHRWQIEAARTYRNPAGDKMAIKYAQAQVDAGAWVLPHNEVWNVPPRGQDEIRFEMEAVGPWSILKSIRGLVTDGQGRVYGMRTMTNLQESGYAHYGQVSIGGKKVKAFTSSVLFERPDGSLCNVGVLHLVTSALSKLKLNPARRNPASEGDRVYRAVRDAMKIRVGSILPRSKMAPVVKEISKHTKSKRAALDVFSTLFKGSDPDDFDALWNKRRVEIWEDDSDNCEVCSGATTIFDEDDNEVPCTFCDATGIHKSARLGARTRRNPSSKKTCSICHVSFSGSRERHEASRKHRDILDRTFRPAGAPRWPQPMPRRNPSSGGLQGAIERNRAFHEERRHAAAEHDKAVAEAAHRLSGAALKAAIDKANAKFQRKLTSLKKKYGMRG